MGREGEETGKRQEAKGRGDGLYNQYSAVYNSEPLYKNRRTSTLILDRGKAAEPDIYDFFFSFMRCE